MALQLDGTRQEYVKKLKLKRVESMTVKYVKRFQAFIVGKVICQSSSGVSDVKD